MYSKVNGIMDVFISSVPMELLALSFFCFLSLNSQSIIIITDSIGICCNSELPEYQRLALKVEQLYKVNTKKRKGTGHFLYAALSAPN